jgi:hypothetical protein
MDNWLVVSNMTGLFSIIWMGCHPNPIDELIFFKMVVAPPTRWFWICIMGTWFSHDQIWKKNIWENHEKIMVWSPWFLLIKPVSPLFLVKMNVIGDMAHGQMMIFVVYLLLLKATRFRRSVKWGLVDETRSNSRVSTWDGTLKHSMPQRRRIHSYPLVI